MNNWEFHPHAIVEADDFQDRYDRNGLNYLFYWKSKFPKFKITLFTIPEKTSQPLLNLALNTDWIQLAMHGWSHESNFECYHWDYDTAMTYIERVEKMGCFIPVFKAPGWTITHKYNGYPADESLPVAKDETAVYRAFRDKGWLVFDRNYNSPIALGNLVVMEDNPKIVHMHTWDMETGDKNGKNGFGQVVQIHGEPWNNDTEFYFINEAIEKEHLIVCKK